MKLLLESKDPNDEPKEVEIIRSGGRVYLMLDEAPSIAGSAATVPLTALEAAQLCNALREAFELELELPTWRKVPRYGVPR